jgi:uncharacterized protein YidB (DUF937 family)
MTAIRTVSVVSLAPGLPRLWAENITKQLPQILPGVVEKLAPNSRPPAEAAA